MMKQDPIAVVSARARTRARIRVRLALGLAGLVSGLSAASPAHAQALHYKFAEKGAFCVNSGTVGAVGDLNIHTADGGGADFHVKDGPLGKACLDLTSATGMGTGFVGPCAKGAAGTVFDQAVSFTVTGWFNAHETPEKIARIFQAGPRFMLCFVGHGLSLQTGQGDYIDSVSSLHGLVEGGQGKTTASPEPVPFNVVDQWVFFAVSYDNTGSETRVTFYRGDTSATKPLLAFTATYVPAARELGNTPSFVLGGSGVPNTRPFRGMLADIRVYASASDGSAALGVAAVEKIRTSFLSR